mmetsp:Transcript_12484/g.29918  ORF Transcript_12484/g.29918 Transcript_12484/m.29918 type:complete len:231 (+) Transcript_12484:838-1530(+)
MFATERMPLMRSRLAPLFLISMSIQLRKMPMSISQTMSMPRLVTVESCRCACTCALSVFKNSGSIWRVRARLNAPMLSTRSTEISELVDRSIGEKLLIARSSDSILLSFASSGTRSTLFRRIRFAKATCFKAAYSPPSCTSTSRCCSMYFASTTVTIPSSVVKFFTSSLTKKVWATGPGSAIPVVSIMIPSSAPPPASCLCLSFSSTTTRSSRTVQQMHPFIISMSSLPS